MLTSLDWKLILLVFGFLLTGITTVISIIVMETIKVLRNLKASIDLQNQRLESLRKELKEYNHDRD